MTSSTKTLYGVELDITTEARAQGFSVPKGGYWVLRSDPDSGLLHVYDRKKDAVEVTKGCDHMVFPVKARVVKFVRVDE